MVGMRALPGNPYDGHSLAKALEQVEILTEERPKMAFVDREYRRHGVEHVKVFIKSAKLGATRAIANLQHPSKSRLNLQQIRQVSRHQCCHIILRRSHTGIKRGNGVPAPVKERHGD